MSDSEQSAAENLVFPSIIGLDMGVNPQEDRVVMIARTHAQGSRVILLTRRMMIQLLGHYSDLMKRTSPAVARAPSAQQLEVLQMEHVGALIAGGSQATPAPASDAAATPQEAPRPAESVHLVTEIRLQVSDTHLILGFMGQSRHAIGVDETRIDPVAAATMDRAEAHRFLAMLNDKAREAGWGLEGLCPWLTSDGLAASAQLQVN